MGTWPTDEQNFLSNFEFDVEYIDSGCNREAMLTTADTFYKNKQNGKSKIHPRILKNSPLVVFSTMEFYS